MESIAAGLSQVQVIPGRLERIDANGVSVIIDYAHTDDALKNVLTALKNLCQGRLWVVFGCGGDRDRTKRPRMGRVAEHLSDFVVITSDNPRTEHPAAIIGEIVTGFDNPAAETVFVEMDRKKAIEIAVQSAAAGDVILIAGKGHETYQIVGTEKIDFSDRDIVQQLLEEPR
jgi:UDP-N-acetylmuramoyl-L-alanyl-D-glutamate--2,6-diaminopimelate ligase